MITNRDMLYQLTKYSDRIVGGVTMMAPENTYGPFYTIDELRSFYIDWYTERLDDDYVSEALDSFEEWLDEEIWTYDVSLSFGF